MGEVFEPVSEREQIWPRACETNHVCYEVILKPRGRDSPRGFIKLAAVVSPCGV